MSNVYFISDFHLGHKNILKLEGENREGDTVDEHDLWLYNCWHDVVNKKDLVFVLGDVAFSQDKLEWFQKWEGRKILVRGNHDTLSENWYRSIFERIYGIFKYKGHWLTHAPIHPQSLRDCPNIHGHLHSGRVTKGMNCIDERYKSACVEILRGYPTSLKDLIEINSTERTE